MLIPIRPLLATLAVLTGLLALPGAARAAQSYDACEGRFIESLPVVIGTQGVWCMRKDLTTAITTGAAITIATNNVTIDCNDFKLGGLAAGSATMTSGILAEDRLNATVRNCNIRGFYAGVSIEASSRTHSAGHVVQDNRFASNTRYGIFLEGDGSVVERNKVIDTGGSTSVPGAAVGISVTYDGDVLGNLVSNLAAVPNGSGAASANGIQVLYSSGTIAGNRVRGLAVQGSGTAVGILTYDDTSTARPSVHDNDLVGPGTTPSAGVYCYSAKHLAHDNTIGGFITALTTCTDGGNFVGP
ncbi:right-handed parallel beta-helix repeat-containing protein [Agrilutibacter solisilvae]|uniref:Right-handed parallel beta-helix repeat-containing protein n=1 Tax=Agrilutibacter solisilvae TaxID=2763317 RepID=A0A974Y4N9_9GAMM|nr:right-handed parallel beta-helix repeat-containing protein [Lysobacter solisilvae]QSX77956.1 right-handed parallel beta-helix repeat-containing protein [Lysobacter solisilvae]